MQVFLLCLLFLGFASGQFFHESSGLGLQPDGGTNTSDFGFSLAYKESSSGTKLLVGAPRQDYIGKVYSCPLTNLLSTIKCSNINMDKKIVEKTSEARKNIYPGANFFLGASIAASTDFFFTCGPLLTKTLMLRKNSFRPIEPFPDTYGGCYVYNDTREHTEWIDLAARLEDVFAKDKKFLNSPSFKSNVLVLGGALGWSTLADDEFLLSVKSSYRGDIIYTSVGKPTQSSRSLYDGSMEKVKKVKALFDNYFNVGYGLTVGNFFNTVGKLYAFSLTTYLDGKILFLQKQRNEYDDYDFLDIFENNSTGVVHFIENDELSSMFGYVVAAADINRDGLSELLVGAPAKSIDGIHELGAMHIYVGGDLDSRNDKKRQRTVLADKADGRFGSAIATSDIDGDNMPEIFVSAPHEGAGVVYVLSGSELNQVFFRNDRFKEVRLTQLKRTQRLQGDSGFQRFGFSLQVVKDVDQNGCDELAIGSPSSNSVKLVRCLPAITTSLKLELLGDKIVAVDAKSFSVSVCLNIRLNEKCQSIFGNITVECKATGKTNISTSTFNYELKSNEKNQSYCTDVKVDLIKSEQNDYIFTTKLNISRNETNPKEYKSWAVLSSQSERDKEIKVRRYCTGPHCEPKLTYQYLLGKNYIELSKPKGLREPLTFEVKNDGNDAHYVVLELEVTGALVQGECNKNDNDLNKYTCALGKIPKNDTYKFTVQIYLKEQINARGLNVFAKVYDTIFPDKVYQGTPLFIEYKYDTSDITVIGSYDNQTITDADLKHENILAYTGINHKFIITNKGPVTWYGLPAALKIKEDYKDNVTIVTRSEDEKWVRKSNDTNELTYECQFTLKSNSTKIIEVTIFLSHTKLENDIKNGNLNVTSELLFHLLPKNETLQAESSTQLHYHQFLTVVNSKWMTIAIVIVVAVVLLLILIFVLYKYGFFKRAEKRELDDLRHSVRKRSVRLASERSTRPSQADGGIANGEFCHMEVVDDSAFLEVELAPPQSSSSVADLIKHATTVNGR